MSIQDDYNNWADIYDTNINKTRDLDAFATREMLQRFEFKNILELGCGTGKNTKWFLHKGEHITGVDFSKEMLKKAQSKIKADKVNFIQADLNNQWNFTSQKYDLISVNLVLEHIKDLDMFFSKAYDKLKKNGLFFISELHPYKQYIGSKARFDISDQTIELTTFTHHLTDYTNAANKNKFKLFEIKEWFDNDNLKTVPRLINFIFQK